MTTCEREREQIGAFLDEELEAGERAALEAHLATCVGCRQALDEHQRLAAAFAALPTAEAPADFEARFWARIAREAESPAGFGARLRGFFSPVRVLAMAGVAAAALLLILDQPSAPEPTPGADAAGALESAAEPATALARAPVPAAADTDVRIVSSDRDFELLQDPEMDAISELDVLEEWDDAGPS